MTNDEPFAFRGYYPLYSTANAAVKASPDPLKIRKGETTVGYHTHMISNILYYMPNGLVADETQFHGNYRDLSEEDNDEDRNNQDIEDEVNQRIGSGIAYQIAYQENGEYYDSRDEPLGPVPSDRSY